MADIIVVKQNVAEKVAVNPAPVTITGQTLVPATNTTLGGIIVGDNLSITGNGVLSAQPGGVTAFNNRTGNVSLTSNDVTTLVDANYIQIWKDTQTTAGTLSQFPKYGSITAASGPIQGYSRGLLTSNTSGTITKTIFDGSLYSSSGSTILQYKSIGFNSNDTGAANTSKTGRLLLGQYGEVYLESSTKVNANTLTTATFDVQATQRPSGTTQVYDPHSINGGIHARYAVGTAGAYAPSTNADKVSGGVVAEIDLYSISQIVRYSNGTAFGRPSQIYLTATNDLTAVDPSLAFEHSYDYKTTLKIGESAELVFQNANKTSLRTPNMTDYSILTQGYADTRYQAVGAYLTSANLTYANLTGTPTTLAGYGITDGLTSANLTPYLTIANANSAYSVLGHTHAIANVTGLQTALDAKLPSANFTYANLAGPQNLLDTELIRAKLRDYSETVSSPTISAGTLTLNLETSNIFTVALNAAITTLTISNPPASGSGGSFTLIFTADGTPRSVNWTLSSGVIKWAGGTAPTLTSTSGKVDSFAFFTSDGGTTWQGYIGGQNF